MQKRMRLGPPRIATQQSLHSQMLQQVSKTPVFFSVLTVYTIIRLREDFESFGNKVDLKLPSY